MRPLERETGSSAIARSTRHRQITAIKAIAYRRCMTISSLLVATGDSPDEFLRPLFSRPLLWLAIGPGGKFQRQNERHPSHPPVGRFLKPCHCRPDRPGGKVY